MKSTQSRCDQTQKITSLNHNLHPATPNRPPEANRQKCAYCKPNLEPLGELHQIVRGSSAKGVDCAGELDLATYPF